MKLRIFQIKNNYFDPVVFVVVFLALQPIVVVFFRDR